MKAVKGNRVYTISETEKEARRADGYDIYDDDGNLIAYHKGKTVPYEQYTAVVSENQQLKTQLAAVQPEEGETEKSSRGGKKG